ncbi:MAG: hypothetical protein LIO64_01360 [Akkermansia sp.]|nr:hypothetical protein [Akkermansia sp.]
MEKPSLILNFFPGFSIPGSHEVLLEADRKTAETVFSGGSSSPGAEMPAKRHRTGMMGKKFIEAVFIVIHANISLSRSKGKMQIHEILLRFLFSGIEEIRNSSTHEHFFAAAATILLRLSRSWCSKPSHERTLSFPCRSTALAWRIT